MIHALELTNVHIRKNRLFIVKGDDALLRDLVLSKFGSFRDTFLAGSVSASAIVGKIRSCSVTLEGGCVLVRCAELLKEDARFDCWLHQKERYDDVVLLVSVAEKLNSHYMRVASRRGLIVNCDIPQDLQVVKKWARARAAHKGVNLSSHLVAELVENCTDLMVVDHVIDMIKYTVGRKTITESAINEMMIHRGGGIPKAVVALFNKDKRAVGYVVEALRWGLSVHLLFHLLSNDVLMRVRIKELGVRRASQLQFDRRFISFYFSQASQMGVHKMWDMLGDINTFAQGGALGEVLFLRWLFGKLF